MCLWINSSCLLKISIVPACGVRCVVWFLVGGKGLVRHLSTVLLYNLDLIFPLSLAHGLACYITFFFTVFRCFGALFVGVCRYDVYMQFSGLIVGYVRSGVIIANGPRSGHGPARHSLLYKATNCCSKNGRVSRVGLCRFHVFGVLDCVCCAWDRGASYSTQSGPSPSPVRVRVRFESESESGWCSAPVSWLGQLDIGQLSDRGGSGDQIPLPYFILKPLFFCLGPVVVVLRMRCGLRGWITSEARVRVRV
jgi:hypothetical protein